MCGSHKPLFSFPSENAIQAFGNGTYLSAASSPSTSPTTQMRKQERNTDKVDATHQENILEQLEPTKVGQRTWAHLVTDPLDSFRSLGCICTQGSVSSSLGLRFGCGNATRVGWMGHGGGSLVGGGCVSPATGRSDPVLSRPHEIWSLNVQAEENSPASCPNQSLFLTVFDQLSKKRVRV